MRIVEELPYKVRVEEHLLISLSDGTRLAARLWLPEGAEEAPVPAILEYIPYRKRDLTRVRDDMTHHYLAGHGYACLRVDLRGSGESEGVLVDQYRQQEMDDGYEVIHWLSEQRWCNGSVGMMGISWGGFNSLQIAAMRPPALKAIITACSTDDLYLDNMHYMGGCLLTDNLSESTTMFSVNTCPPDPALVGERWREMWLQRLAGSGLWLDIWLRHQRRDDYWRHGSVCEDYAAIQCPVMAVGGWADGYTNAIFRLLEHLEVPRLGLVGPWGHKYPHLGRPGPAIGFLQEALRWWDHWLKGQETGIMEEPMLRAWMQASVPPTTRYSHRPGRWIAERRWPSPDVEWRSYYLAPHRLVTEPGQRRQPEAAQTLQSPLSVGLFAGKWCSYTAAPDLPHDQREEDGGALVYDSPVLEEPLEILGAPQFELEFSVNRPVAMVAVRLSDVAPDDKATRITYGLLNLTHRNGNAESQPLEPGRRYRVKVGMNHIAQQFPVGHRLRLSISTSYWPLAWPPPASVCLMLYSECSVLKLPIRRPNPDDEAVHFEEPEGTAPARVEHIEPPHHNWLVHRDLAEDRSVLEVIKDEGVYRIDEIELEVGDRTWDRYSYQGDDFTSLRGETRTERTFRRGDWAVRTTTRTVLTADTNHFYIRAELDAYEGESRVFSENWSLAIPRDGV
ncbi:MAG: CocE/NonD family hydrolase [Gammaproteobacteria bacterium]|nr:CocE/NonD family hydrolase [Gammaproteobacteria bacterium]MCW8972966.1 CocE/NonD family hydrolase [Gammaproteobacteria bacterium]MCW8992987.1 CocE/NonD family hydrolase [Gammaproteobacteria bacterium]